MGTLVAVLSAIAGAAFVLAPLVRRDAGLEERRAAGISEEEDLQSRREMTLAALKDLEDDRATGKIGDADYETFKSRLTVQALAILKRLDALEQERTAAAGLDRIGPQGLRRSRET